jgi:hypothetical protein
MKTNIFSLLAAAALSGTILTNRATAADAPVGYTDTPMLPGGKWHVHDPNRPQPKVVTPGTFSAPEIPGKPPSDAIVLFDGKDLSKWRTGDGKPSSWKVENGAMVVPQKKQKDSPSEDIWTREEFGDCQLHIEFATPNPPKGDSQARGNSGVFFFGIYEFQVLDSFNNRTYADGGAASLYGQHPPMSNASKPPGEWQVYDIIFTAPRFKEGKLESSAIVTAFHNGVVVQNHTAYLGPSGHKSMPAYKAHGPKGPLKLQDHGDPMRFRNIWVRPVMGQDEQ